MAIPMKQDQSSISNGTSGPRRTRRRIQWGSSGSGEGGGRGRGSPVSSGRGRRPEAFLAGLRLPTVLWRCAESVCERNKLGGSLFIGEAEAGIESSPEFSAALLGNEWCQ